MVRSMYSALQKAGLMPTETPNIVPMDTEVSGTKRPADFQLDKDAVNADG